MLLHILSASSNISPDVIERSTGPRVRNAIASFGLVQSLLLPFVHDPSFASASSFPA
jgi:hypothetical protein